ncbi:hypothetical protein P153DRAFT_333118 [Dothidotthia symphoricarpi CBS 119687]|uniref:Uncharacterized protein n=1 Tax=Dothidotthia symphoricarpi CBS 119687 TaxID=1392245 RepID=A0A6A6AND5_9PLEO|nr:uncharacterized protein P153DRAFT_333118 [Dothidotthia symphoricarpi CBS 119687]KAF2132658.1 hypothetical protein P153DRAFT_333118 [Dothidotthia symphoricarpi CBS 119687]
MYQRHMCPSVGVLRRSLAGDVVATSKCSSRALHVSVKRQDDQQPSGAAPSAPTPANPNSRTARNAAAFKQIASLPNRRIIPGGLARGNFPSGQTAPPPRRQPSSENPAASTPDATPSSGAPRPAKLAKGPRTPRTTSPTGTMARAPNKLRITREPMLPGFAPSPRGPNLQARQDRRGAGPGGDRGAKGGPGRGNEDRPKKRERKTDGGNAARMAPADVKVESTLSDGMVHHLLRLQRKEWDRVPYEPKYAPGSFAANELVHAGRELFRGEVPPVQVWGALERRIGVVGMHGAAAHLKVRRVLDGDAEPFGEEEENTLKEKSG